MAILTPNYSFNKPTVGGDTDAWGTLLNSNWDSVDSLLSGGTPLDGVVLTNADITATTVDLSGTVTIADASITATDVLTDSLSVNGPITEKIATISGLSPTIEPDNGTIQFWTLTGASSPSYSISAGQTVTIGIDAAVGSVTWPATQWIGGVAPSLSISGTNWITLWSDGANVYGAFAGASA